MLALSTISKSSRADSLIIHKQVTADHCWPCWHHGFLIWYVRNMQELLSLVETKAQRPVINKLVHNFWEWQNIFIRNGWSCSSTAIVFCSCSWQSIEFCSFSWQPSAFCSFSWQSSEFLQLAWDIAMVGVRSSVRPSGVRPGQYLKNCLPDYH